MATSWIMVRVSKATHAALEAARESMKLGQEMGLRTLPCDDRDRVSLSAVIDVLLDARERHLKRARKSNRTRSARRTQERYASIMQ